MPLPSRAVHGATGRVGVVGVVAVVMGLTAAP